MLTQKLLAAVGLTGALLVGTTTDASANPWFRPVYRPVVAAPVYRAPVVIRPVVAAPVYTAPVYAPPAPVVVYQTPVYAPVYRPWHHHYWVRPYLRRW